MRDYMDGGLPHLRVLPHLPGVPHLHVDRPLIYVTNSEIRLVCTCQKKPLVYIYLGFHKRSNARFSCWFSSSAHKRKIRFKINFWKKLNNCTLVDVTDQYYNSARWCHVTTILYYDQNPSGFYLLVQIRAFVF